MTNALPTHGQDLVRAVRSGFVLRGTSLGKWCRENRINPQNARVALLGGWNGPKGRALRERIIRAAGLRTHKAAA